MMPVTITTSLRFPASHQLRLYDGSLEELHGHDWKVMVTVGARELDEIGVVMDFHDLSRRVEQHLALMRGRRLNDLAAFATRNPSAENVAIHLAESLLLPPSVTLEAVEVWETPENSAVWRR